MTAKIAFAPNDGFCSPCKCGHMYCCNAGHDNHQDGGQNSVRRSNILAVRLTVFEQSQTCICTACPPPPHAVRPVIANLHSNTTCAKRLPKASSMARRRDIVAVVMVHGPAQHLGSIINIALSLYSLQCSFFVGAVVMDGLLRGNATLSVILSAQIELHHSKPWQDSSGRLSSRAEHIILRGIPWPWCAV